MTCKMCEILKEEGITDECPQCMRDRLMKTMPYLAMVLEELRPKYNITLDESLFDILDRMTSEDSEKLKMAMKYPLGKLRIVH